MPDKDAVYGYCPRCKAKGTMRERRPDGNDRCENGHAYPSAEALAFHCSSMTMIEHLRRRDNNATHKIVSIPEMEGLGRCEWCGRVEIELELEPCDKVPFEHQKS